MLHATWKRTSLISGYLVLDTVPALILAQQSATDEALRMLDSAGGI
jgi:hypothetical protein